jgi:pimeloyl-ACP methyl ester carboxylesterase
VAAAVKVVRRLGARKVFLVGASMGGTAVLVAAVNVRPAVAGVVSISGPAVFGAVDALAVAPRLSVPVLYLAGKEDVDFASDAQKLYQATGEQEKTLRVLPTGAHGVALLGTSATARALVQSFLGSH